jgi:DNA-binding transcriptional LysR family regulator
MDIADIDLNLLKVLDALVEERSLARAAKRLDIEQGTLGRSLSKLRRLLDDPLVVRQQGRLQPTPRALELAQAVRLILVHVVDLFERSPIFEPATSHQTFTLGATDYAELVILPRLTRWLATQAPSVRVAVRHLGEGFPSSELETGRVDLAVGVFPSAPDGFSSQALFLERLVAVVRKGHPSARERLSAADFAALQHLSIGDGDVALAELDAALARSGVKRTLGLRLPNVLVAPMVVAQTDFVASLDERIARHFGALLPIRPMKIPVELGTYPVVQAWHPRTESSPALRWLRAGLAEVGRSL